MYVEGLILLIVMVSLALSASHLLLSCLTSFTLRAHLRYLSSFVHRAVLITASLCSPSSSTIFPPVRHRALPVPPPPPPPFLLRSSFVYYSSCFSSPRRCSVLPCRACSGRDAERPLEHGRLQGAPLSHFSSSPHNQSWPFAALWGSQCLSADRWHCGLIDFLTTAHVFDAQLRAIPPWAWYLDLLSPFSPLASSLRPSSPPWPARVWWSPLPISWGAGNFHHRGLLLEKTTIIIIIYTHIDTRTCVYIYIYSSGRF